jgi:ABC-type antimicrobial peptide transport system permease subunit
MTLGVIGVGIGTAVALLAGTWIKPLLFDESPRDPIIFGTVAFVLLAVTMIASFIPARRASRVDPNRALRSD